MKGFLFADSFMNGKRRGNNVEGVIYKIFTENVNIEEMRKLCVGDRYVHVSKLENFGGIIRKVASFSTHYNQYLQFLISVNDYARPQLIIETQRWYHSEDFVPAKELLPDEEVIKAFQIALGSMPKGSMSSKTKKQIIEQITSNLL